MTFLSTAPAQPPPALLTALRPEAPCAGEGAGAVSTEGYLANSTWRRDTFLAFRVKHFGQWDWEWAERSLVAVQFLGVRQVPPTPMH
jgi:hypothetical protein